MPPPPVAPNGAAPMGSRARQSGGTEPNALCAGETVFRRRKPNCFAALIQRSIKITLTPGGCRRPGQYFSYAELILDTEERPQPGAYLRAIMSFNQTITRIEWDWPAQESGLSAQDQILLAKWSTFWERTITQSRRLRLH
jgi:hypothetical protein